MNDSPTRTDLVPREVFEEGPFRIATAVRQSPPAEPDDRVYDFRVYRQHRMTTRISMDFHPEIGDGSYILEQRDGKTHRTLSVYTKDPGYEVAKARTLEWLRQQPID